MTWINFKVANVVSGRQTPEEFPTKLTEEQKHSGTTEYTQCHSTGMYLSTYFSQLSLVCSDQFLDAFDVTLMLN